MLVTVNEPSLVCVYDIWRYIIMNDIYNDIIKYNIVIMSKNIKNIGWCK